MKLTQTLVSETPFAASGQTFIRDEELRGFALRIGKSSKSYIVEGRAGGRVRRVRIGDVTHMTITEARKRAKLELANMADGIDTNAAKAKAKSEAVTLREGLDSFLATRKLKPSTLDQYAKGIPRYFSQWMDRPMRDITPNAYVATFDRLLEAHGESSAALATRVFGSIWNHTRAATADEDGNPILRESPSIRVKSLKKMPKAVRRQDHIKDVKGFFAALATVPSEDFRDMFELAFRTGARRSELATLQWADVSFRSQTFTFPNTKNSRPHTLPMSRQVEALFRRLEGRHGGETFIWGKAPLRDPRKSLLAFQKAYGDPLTLHSCRRSFINFADDADVTDQKIKALVNHADKTVTDGYRTNRDPERLREAMQAVNDHIDARSTA